MEEVNPCTTTEACVFRAHEPQSVKPTRLKSVLRNEKPPQQEARAPQLESSLHSPQPEKSPRAATKAGATTESLRRRLSRAFFVASERLRC